MKCGDLVCELVDIVSDEDFKIEEWDSIDTQKLQAIVRFLDGRESMWTQRGTSIVSDRI